jgi:hypothetical protein
MTIAAFAGRKFQAHSPDAVNRFAFVTGATRNRPVGPFERELGLGMFGYAEGHAVKAEDIMTGIAAAAIRAILKLPLMRPSVAVGTLPVGGHVGKTPRGVASGTDLPSGMRRDAIGEVNCRRTDHAFLADCQCWQES